MFEQLFKRSHALARQRSGPLVEERRRYLAYLADQGWARRPLIVVAYYLLRIVEYLRLGERPDEVVSSVEIEEAARRWGDRTGSDWAREHFCFRATHWLRFLGRLQPPPRKPQPYADHLADFAAHMSREQGLSPRTV
jgi:hypothetical protein